VDIDFLAQTTQGFSGADLTEICQVGTARPCPACRLPVPACRCVANACRCVASNSWHCVAARLRRVPLRCHGGGIVQRAVKFAIRESIEKDIERQKIREVRTASAPNPRAP
jgi:hypothetical protein